MPEMNGVEATQQIHDVSLNTGADSVDAFATTEHIFRALQTGARGCQRASPLESTSRRERQILQLVAAEGKSSVEVAAMLFPSPKTVDTYHSRMMG